MLSFLKKIFSAAEPDMPAEVPYKVEAPKAKVDEFPFPKPKAEKKTADKKPAAKTKATRKPRAPKAPKA